MINIDNLYKYIRENKYTLIEENRMYKVINPHRFSENNFYNKIIKRVNQFVSYGYTEKESIKIVKRNPDIVRDFYDNKIVKVREIFIDENIDLSSSQIKNIDFSFSKIYSSSLKKIYTTLRLLRYLKLLDEILEKNPRNLITGTEKIYLRFIDLRSKKVSNDKLLTNIFSNESKYSAKFSEYSTLLRENSDEAKAFISVMENYFKYSRHNELPIKKLIKRDTNG